MNIRNPIPYIYYSLVGIMTFVFFSGTSELFEFNKIVFVYIATILVVFFWSLICISEKKFIFKRSILDLPIAIFLFSQLVSTLFSIDPHTSTFGYYSRFNGGLLSITSYATLYWGFVTFMDRYTTQKLLKISIVTAFFVSIIAVLERFDIGITCMFLAGKTNTSCWVQKVTERVFSTLGQPNWLAAYLVIISPITWAFFVNKAKFEKFYILISSVLFLALIFTKSRSGILGYICALTFFLFFLIIKKAKRSLKTMSVVFLISGATIAIFGTPWTPGITDSLSSTSNQNVEKQDQNTQTVLEQGGTESGEIRKIVWKGAFDIFTQNPIIGTGPETFAYAYYFVRPKEHNLTSEWNYVYNKAHNEYLNYLANTGLFGFLSYMTVLVFIYLLFTNRMGLISPKILKKYVKKIDKRTDQLYCISFISACSGLLVSNFFGFTVVVTSLFLYLLPAFIATVDKNENKYENIVVSLKSDSNKILNGMSVFFVLVLLFMTGAYWYADVLYKDGMDNVNVNNVLAEKRLNQAISIAPNEFIYLIELAEIQTAMATASTDQNQSKAIAADAISNAETASKISPENVNIQRRIYFIYDLLSTTDPNNILKARNSLVYATKLAPTDPKLFLSLGINSVKIGQTEDAASYFEKAIYLKPNYEKARMAIAYIFADTGQKQKALDQVNYILANINPQNPQAIELKKELEEGL